MVNNVLYVESILILEIGKQKLVNQRDQTNLLNQTILLRKKSSSSISDYQGDNKKSKKRKSSKSPVRPLKKKRIERSSDNEITTKENIEKKFTTLILKLDSLNQFYYENLKK